MRKKTLLSLSLLFACALSQLNAQTMMQNWLTKSNNAAITNSDDQPYYTHVDGNGMIGIVGVSNSKVILSTYDANGNDLWTNKYGTYSSDSPLGLEKGPSGNYYVGYFWSGVVRKIGLTGSTMWTVSSSSYHGADFAVDASGNVYMVGSDYSRSTIYIDKFLTNGTKLWTKTYTGFYGFGGQPTHVKIDHAGNLLIALNATNAIGDRYISVAKFDTVGTNPTQVWHNIYSTTIGQAYDFVVDKITNASYVTGSVNVGGFNQNDVITYKSGPSGAINWSDVYNEVNSDDKGCSIEQDVTGNIYVLFDSHTPMTKYSIRKYTSGGSLLASNGITYQSNGVYNALPKIKIHQGNNQIYFSGTKTSFANDNMLVLYKADMGLTSINSIYTYNHDVTDYDYSTAIDVDPTSQNLILTGNIQKNITGNDYYYAKTDTLGSFIYSNIYNGVINGKDYASSLVTDASNFPIVAGGTGSTLTGLDGFMVKYDAAGNEQWQSVFTGAGGFNDYFNTIAVNTSGHYYTGGFTENGTNNFDMWLMKVDGNGTKLWDIALSGTQSAGHDEITDIVSDNFNNGYAVGHQTNTGTGRDASIIKFNSSGTILWNKKLTGPGNAADGFMDLEYDGGLYAVGYTTKANGERDMLIAKYGTVGNLNWSTTLNSTQNGNDTAISVTTDANNVYVVGRSDSAKVILAKYSQSGNFAWATSEPYITEVGPDVVALNNGMVFITCFWDSASIYANRVICYNSMGTKLWSRNYVYSCCEHPMKMERTSRGTILVAIDYYGYIGAIELDTMGNEKNNVLTYLNVNGDAHYGGTRSLTIDGNGDVYVAGFFMEETGNDIVAQKICYTPAPVVVSGTDSVCYGANNVIYSVNTNSTITGYNWTYPAGASGSVTTNSMSVNFATASSGYITVKQTNYCGTGNADSLLITVLPLPTINAGADQFVCPNATVTLSGSGGVSYAWNNSVTNGTPFSASMPLKYTVTGTNMYGCSNKDSVFVGMQIPPTPSICMVTVDSLSKYNIVMWDKTTLMGVNSFNIYREDITNNYTLIASVDYDSLSQYIDKDPVADPNVTTKRYKISCVDTCGNEGMKSNYHNTIYITDNGSGQFSWAQLYSIQNYGGNPVNNYVLMVDSLNNGNWFQRASTAGTQQNINDVYYNNYSSVANWRVETVWGITCTPTQRQGNNSNQTAIIRSKSNITNNRVSGIKNTNENNFSIYPNPTNGNLTLSFANTSQGKTTIKITSLLGEEVYSEILNQTNNKHIIDLSKYENGIYLMQVTSNNTTVIKRVVKN